MTGVRPVAEDRGGRASLGGRIDRDGVRWDQSGLVPGVVQDAADGRVLMVAYLDREALDATLDTGEVHFHSRSRDRLWRKGETSGNVLRLVDATVDCDADALLLTVEASGPTCHTGARSCFDDAAASGTDPLTSALTNSREAPSSRAGRSPAAVQPQGFAWLEKLWATISQRAADRPEGSYTAGLVGGGVDVVGRKVVEEATEVLIAAKDDAAGEAGGSTLAKRQVLREALAGEVADLLFHALVLTAERGLEPAATLDALRDRHRP